MTRPTIRPLHDTFGGLPVRALSMVDRLLQTSATIRARFGPWVHGTVAVLVVAALLALAVSNFFAQATWREVEDGALWEDRPEGVIAAEVAADSAGARAGLQPGDLLLAINEQRIDRVEQVFNWQHGSTRGTELQYRVRSAAGPSIRTITLAPIPAGHRSVYFPFAVVGIFTLLVGCSIRLQRPHHQATLHFFWLTIAFFGICAFSYTGKLDRLDWVYYWADVVAMLALPPLFMHFALVFPERPNPWARTVAGRTLVPLMYAPAVLLGGARAVLFAREVSGETFSRLLERIDRLEMVYLTAGLLIGLAIMVHALRRMRSVTARRQLRWIVWGTTLGALPFVLGYSVPWMLGFEPWAQVGLLAIPLALVPLAFASAVVRYRLMDVEVIIKRTLVSATAIAAIAAIYAVLLKLASELFLGGSQPTNSVIAVLATLVVVLLAPIVKNAIQTALDRAHYRGRYDYRRALVGFARDLNRDLDIHRLSERLVHRVMETLDVDRMALLSTPLSASLDQPGALATIRAHGFEGETVRLPRESGIGEWLASGQAVALDELLTARRFSADEVRSWRDQGVHYFVPCHSKEGLIAVMALGARPTGEPLSSEDMALLTAVAGQVATAIENGRLYHQLHEKARELDRLRGFNENVLQSLQDGLLVSDLDDRVVRWNVSMEQLHGLSAAAAIGRRLDELFDPAFLDTLRRAQQGGGPAFAYRVPLTSRHQYEARTVLVNAATAPVRTPEGETAGTILIIEDITQRVQLEEQLQISEKMASLGLLAAGVAHEVNTPLTGISSFTQMLLEQSDPRDPKRRLLEKIERQTFRAAKIVNGLLNLARPAQVDAEPLDVHVVINDVLSLVEHQFRTSRIQVRKAFGGEAPVIKAVEHKLQQVFLNLFLNARDAMPKGGWLSLVTRTSETEVTIELADTGGGIPSEHLSRIYDPFFTTKPIGHGTGLGLSITYGIVHDHDGAITCETMPGQGTKFTLTFPRAAASGARRSEGVKG
ncbi:MAG: PAS domain-containing protein [Luteitalea sp.]|nr:PAS domain-containing protein [Luteitalea sp.]